MNPTEHLNPPNPKSLREALRETINGLPDQTTTSLGDVILHCCECGKAFPVPLEDRALRENHANFHCEPCRQISQDEFLKSVRRRDESRREKLLSQIPNAFRRTDREKLPKPEKLDRAMEWSFGPRGMLLYGPTGCGKSRVLWEVAKREILNGRRVRAITGYDLIRYPALFMESSNAASEFSDGLVHSELLILDDVFKAKPTERVEELLFAVVDERTSWDRPSLVTLNDTGESLESRLSSDRGPALIRRLRESSMVIQF